MRYYSCNLCDERSLFCPFVTISISVNDVAGFRSSSHVLHNRAQSVLLDTVPLIVVVLLFQFVLKERGPFVLVSCCCYSHIPVLNHLLLVN